MSAGHTDSNGVWIYGEDDRPDGTGSGLLNLGQGQTSTAIGGLLARPPYSWANSTARGAQTGMQLGDKGTQHDNGIVYRYDGTNWKAWESDWISWTPTVTGIVVGTAGTLVTRYRYRSGSIEVEVLAKLGTSGFSVGTAPTFTLPVNSAALRHSNQDFSGISKLYQASSSGSWLASVLSSGASVTTALARSAAGTGTDAASITATAPFTWAAGDGLELRGSYEPA